MFLSSTSQRRLLLLWRLQFLVVMMHERARLNYVVQVCSFVLVAVRLFISPPRKVMGSMSQPFVLRENKQ